MGLSWPGAHDFVVSGYLSRGTQSIFEFPVRFMIPSAIYHLSHVQSSQSYILPLCRSAHSFARWARCYSQGRARTRSEKDVSNNFTSSSCSIRRLTKLSSPSYSRATWRKCYHSFLVFSSALLRSAPTARRNRDGGLRAWLAHVFWLRGWTDEVSKQRYLWLFQFLSDECLLGNQAN